MISPPPPAAPRLRRYRAAADLEDPVAAGLQGARETGVDPLANNPSLELSKHTQYLKHHPAGGVRSIHLNATPFRMDADVIRFSVRRARSVECDWPSLPGVGTALFEGLGMPDYSDRHSFG